MTQDMQLGPPTHMLHAGTPTPLHAIVSADFGMHQELTVPKAERKGTMRAEPLPWGCLSGLALVGRDCACRDVSLVLLTSG